MSIVAMIRYARIAMSGAGFLIGSAFIACSAVRPAMHVDHLHQLSEYSLYFGAGYFVTLFAANWIPNDRGDGAKATTRSPRMATQLLYLILFVSMMVLFLTSGLRHTEKRRGQWFVVTRQGTWQIDDPHPQLWANMRSVGAIVVAMATFEAYGLAITRNLSKVPLSRTNRASPDEG